MSATLTPWQLAEPALESCRATIEQSGSCHNLTSYMRAGTPLLTCLWRYADDGDKAAPARLWGRLGLALEADLLVAVTDTWQVEVPRETVGLVPRPSQHPDRFEALQVTAVTIMGTGWEWQQRYSRGDGGPVSFGEVVEVPALVGPVPTGLGDGLRGKPGKPRPHPRVVLQHIAEVLGPVTAFPLHPDVKAVLEPS